MKTRTRIEKQTPILKRNISIKFIDYLSIFSFGFCVLSFLGFFIETLFPINLLVFLTTLGIFTLTTVPRITGFLLKKENKKVSLGLLGFFIFILYIFLAGILGKNNPFLLGFLVFGLLLFPIGIFLVLGKIMNNPLKYFLKLEFQEIAQTLKLKFGILFIIFPFFYSGVSKMIGKEKIELSFLISSFILIFFIFGWKHIKKYFLKFGEYIKIYINNQRVKEIKELNNKVASYLKKEKTIYQNLKHSNNFINTLKLRKGFFFEKYLGYSKSILYSFIVGILFGIYIISNSNEAESLKIILGFGIFFSGATFLATLTSLGKIHKNIAIQIKEYISLGTDSDSFYVINKEKIVFLKK